MNSNSDHKIFSVQKFMSDTLHANPTHRTQWYKDLHLIFPTFNIYTSSYKRRSGILPKYHCRCCWNYMHIHMASFKRSKEKHIPKSKKGEWWHFWPLAFWFDNTIVFDITTSRHAIIFTLNLVITLIRLYLNFQDSSSEPHHPFTSYYFFFLA